MPNEVLQKVGTQIVFANHVNATPEFVGGAAKTSLVLAGATEIELDLTTLTTLNVAESDKFNFGTNRAARYSCMASIESGASAMTIGETIEFYLAPSTQSAATDGNPGQLAGADASAGGGGISGVGTIDELLKQCMFIGSLIVEDTASTVQTGFVGTFSPPEQYGILVVLNNTSESFETNAVEHHVVFNPIVDEIQ